MAGEGNRRREEGATTRLVRRASDGDRVAWDQLYERHRILMRAIVGRRLPRDLRSRLDTEDVMQSGFFAAFQGIDGLKDRGGDEFRRWLTQILVNKINDKVRNHRRDMRDPEREQRQDPERNARHEPAMDETPSEILAAAERQAEVLEGLAALPKADQEILSLRMFDNLSWAEIGERLGISETTARRRGLDAIDRLVK